MKSYQNISVFCGSRLGNKAIYAEEARRLGAELGSRKLHVIYGGGDVGLMGEFSRAAHAHGAEITAIIPEAFIKPAKAGNTPHKTIAVQTLFERKSQMIFQSHLTIALPGGIGTHDENFEILAFNDLEKYQAPEKPIKPLILVNIDGHFDGMKMLLEKSVETGFVDESMLSIIHWASSSKESMRIYDRLASMPPVRVQTLMLK